MKDKIKDYLIGDFKFHVYSLETETGHVRGIDITDAFLGNEQIGFDKILKITFTDPHLIEDEVFKIKNHNNIESLIELSKFILNEIGDLK